MELVMETVFMYCINEDDGVHVVQPELTMVDDDDDTTPLPPLSELGELIAD
jgi:hypothetical protein